MLNKLKERLKKLRADSEISQAKLGAILNVPQQTYNCWEQGQSQPDTDMLIRLAAYFNVSVDYLIGATNDMYRYTKSEQDINVPIINGTNLGIIGGRNNKINNTGFIYDNQTNK